MKEINRLKDAIYKKILLVENKRIIKNNCISNIVCGISENIVHMITAYYPDTNKWEEDMKTRREK